MCFISLSTIIRFSFEISFVPEKNEDVPTFIKKTDDDALSASAVKSTRVSEFYPGLPHMRKDVHWKQTKGEGPIATNVSFFLLLFLHGIYF